MILAGYSEINLLRQNLTRAAFVVGPVKLHISLARLIVGRVSIAGTGGTFDSESIGHYLCSVELPVDTDRSTLTEGIQLKNDIHRCAHFERCRRLGRLEICPCRHLRVVNVPLTWINRSSGRGRRVGCGGRERARACGRRRCAREGRVAGRRSICAAIRRVLRRMT
jgi:hypothetical protein